MKKFLLAVIFLLIGILGIILPGLPGVPFLLVSLYLMGVIDKRRFIRLIRRFGGKRGSFQRKVVAYLLIRVFYKRRFNLK